MKSHRYEKSGRIIFIGFILFALVIIGVVNLYFKSENDYKQGEMDVQMSKEILLESQKINKIFDAQAKDLMIQREWMKGLLVSKAGRTNNPLLNQMIYLADEDISVVDESVASGSDKIGNIILKGNKAGLAPEIKSEINRLDNFFELEKVLSDSSFIDINTIYYSSKHYVTYYPYVPLGESKMDYTAVFESVDRLIEKLQQMDLNDENYDLEQGWDRATLDGTTAQNLSFTFALPVVLGEKVQGILTNSVGEATLINAFAEVTPDKDYYLVDESNTVIYSNNHNAVRLSNLADVFDATYTNLQYYKNKFPTSFEVRYESGKTIYISNLSKSGWQLIFVVPESKFFSVAKILIVNFILFGIFGGVVFVSLKYSRQKRDNIESIIQDSRQDGMTQLLNHKNIMDALKSYTKNRRTRKIAVMMLDLDDFKKVNDSFGHSVGDHVIRVCSEVIKEVIKDKKAVSGRYGGEEFLVAVAGVEMAEAYALAEQIRAEFNKEVQISTGLDVTISIGLKYFEKPFALSPAEMVNEADQNLYKAKNSGKNQVQ